MIIVLILTFLDRVTRIIFLYLERRFTVAMRKVIRENVYKGISEGNPVTIFQKPQEKLSLFTKDVDMVINGISSFLLLSNITFSILGIIGIMLSISPILTLIIGAIIFVFLSIPLLVRRISKRLGKRYSESFQRYVAAVSNALNGYSAFRVLKGNNFNFVYRKITRPHLLDARRQLLKNVGIGIFTSFFLIYPYFCRYHLWDYLHIMVM